MMIPHPILASEDDEDYVIRTILGLPDIVEEFFECLEAIFIYTKGAEYNSRANILFLTIQRQLQTLRLVPSSSFKVLNRSGKDKVDEELPKLLDRLACLFLEDVFGIGPEAISWKRPCLRLAEDCADRMRASRIKFPLNMRIRRQLVTFNSLLFIISLVFFCIIVLLCAVVLVTIPSLKPPVSVGVPIGAVAAGMLLLVSVMLVAYHVIATRALHRLYNNIFQENIIYGTSNALFEVPQHPVSVTDATIISTTHRHGILRSLAPPAAAVSHSPTITRGRETRKGYYTVPYGGDVGYIDGRQLDAQVVMIAYDKDFLITRWNNAAEQMTGFLQDGCVGKPLAELVQSPGGGNICDVLRRARRSDLIKIKLRALAMSPMTLYTVVAPIVNPGGHQVGCVLICANAKDNLREHRSYIHNYQISTITEMLTALVDRGTLTHDDVIITRAMQNFMTSCVANRVEELAREMATDWEWTNVDQLLGRALGSTISSHEVNVDPLFPPTLCMSPLVPKIIGIVTAAAGGRTTINLNVVTPMRNVFSLAVTVVLGGKCRPWDTEKLDTALQGLLKGSCGSVGYLDERVVFRFPCQISAILEDSEEAETAVSDQGRLLTQARTIINCTVNVVTAINNLVDQHNLSLILLKTMFVSLASVRERSDLEQRLSANPCDVDVVICDSEWLSSSRDILLSGDHGAVVIPLVDTGTSLSDDFKYVIRMPIVGRDVQEMIVEVGKKVSMEKNAVTAKEERERILTLRQDSPWTKGKLLGRGSYGAVYEATSDLTGGKMAVKMFYFAADRENSINQLLNEIKIMCSLNHPNIVHYFHCERKDNNVSLFMELCQGSLTDIMIGSRPKPPHLGLVSIIRQVVTAIAYLHGRGIVHRDVKPQNILLKGETIKLTDFGTARQGDATKEVRGTFRYMAPEVYKGEPHSLPCDVWSIGCLVCELLACPPRFMDQASALGELKSTLPYLEGLPQNSLLVDFVQKCFILMPEQRPSSHDLLTHPLLASTTVSMEVDKLPNVLDTKNLRRLGAYDQSDFTVSSVTQE